MINATGNKIVLVLHAFSVPHPELSPQCCLGRSICPRSLACLFKSGCVLQYIADNTPANKEGLNHALGPRREEQQRKEREILIERKRKETTEGKEKKLVREAVAAALSSTRANTSSPRAELNKERTFLLTKESIELSSGME